jgi:hypothetical protein
MKVHLVLIYVKVEIMLFVETQKSNHSPLMLLCHSKTSLESRLVSNNERKDK